jgi:hypothetical protein
VYTPASASCSSPEDVFSTLAAGTIGLLTGPSPEPRNRAGAVGGGTITVFRTAGVMPRSSTP